LKRVVFKEKKELKLVQDDGLESDDILKTSRISPECQNNQKIKILLKKSNAKMKKNINHHLIKNLSFMLEMM
jgi:hypothetical protein